MKIIYNTPENTVSVLNESNTFRPPIEEFHDGKQPLVPPMIKTLELPYRKESIDPLKGGNVHWYSISFDEYNGPDIGMELLSYSGFGLTEWMFENRDQGQKDIKTFRDFLIEFIRLYQKI